MHFNPFYSSIFNSILQEIRQNYITRQPLYDQTNNTYETYQEESILSTTAIPNSTHEKWRKMNADWHAISHYVGQPRTTITEKRFVTIETQVGPRMPDILVTRAEEGTSGKHTMLLFFFFF